MKFTYYFCLSIAYYNCFVTATNLNSQNFNNIWQIIIVINLLKL